MENQKHSHYGHRQRLKDKIREGGIKSLKEHEVLEWLLMYTIPQKDTNELAHDLLNSYGSLYGVLNAQYQDLKKIKGVGDETSLFLSNLPHVLDLCKRNSNKNFSFLRTTGECVEFFRSHYEIKNNEKLYIVCVNTMNKFLKAIEIDGANDSSVAFDIRDITNKLANNNYAGIVMFHTHPTGSPQPSNADFEATKIVLQVCCILGISLFDHVILSESEHFSFASSGALLKLYKDISNIFPNNSSVNNMLQKLNGVKKK